MTIFGPFLSIFGFSDFFCAKPSAIQYSPLKIGISILIKSVQFCEPLE